MSDPFRVVAIVAAFNEGDIISQVIGHLVENGIDVYLIDNHSTDDTVDQANNWLGRGLLDIEQFPPILPPGFQSPDPFDWSAILRRKEELASELDADWFIHHDADEIRESPWPNITLKEAIRWVDTLGYNCIDFKLLNFPPIDDGFKQGDDPRSYFRLYEDGGKFDKLQLKCWKATKNYFSLVLTGGHEARFEGRRIFPIQFLLRHYPIRGQSHGLKKVFTERKGRFLDNERSKGWHVQYDEFKDETHSFLRGGAALRPFDLDRARLDLMLPDKILRDLADRLEKNDEELNALRSHKEELEQYVVKVERGLNECRQHAANLEQAREELEKQLTGIHGDNDNLKEYTSVLQRERDELNSHAGKFEREREELRIRTENLEQARNQLQKQLVGVQREHDELKSHAASLEHEIEALRGQVERQENLRKNAEQRSRALEQDMTAIRNSKSWRWTAPLRRLFDIVTALGNE